MSKVLVSGCNSGLGKYCQEKFKAVGLQRCTDFKSLQQQAEAEPFDAIIHCAWNTNASTMKTNFAQYLQDTVILTEELLKLPSKLFVFISTIDVYPQANAQLLTEEENIDITQISSVYGQVKFMMEQYIQQKTDNYLIIRPSALLGRDARPNSLIKVLTQDNPVLTLSPNSEFNYVLHADVATFIAHAMQKTLTGIYNFVATDNITLGKVCQQYHRNASWGNFTYQSQAVSSHKLAAELPAVIKSSAQAINTFITTNDLIPLKV